MSNTVVLSSIPAAWYPDPSDDSRVRWWDGDGWTDSVTEAPMELPVMTVVPAPRHLPDSPPVLEPQQSTSVVLPPYVPEKPATIAELKLAAAPPPAFLPTAANRADSAELAESLYTPPPRYALPSHQRFTPSRSTGAAPQLGLTLAPPLTYAPVSQRRRDFVPVYDFTPPLLEMRAGTAAAWSVALVPILQFLSVWLVINVFKLELGDVVRYALFAAPSLICILLAYADRKTLVERDFEELPSPLLALLPPFYFVLRAVKVGPSSVLPMLGWLVLELAAIAGLVWQGTISLSNLGL